MLSELAVRAFTGSRDVPKDNIKAMELFQQSEHNALTESEHAHVRYYQLLLKKFKIHQETVLLGVALNEEQEKDMVSINQQLNALAAGGNPFAQYSYGKDLFSIVRNSSIDDKQIEREFL